MTAPTTIVEDDGAALHAFVAELFPITRSLTGDGVRETLRRVGERIPLEIVEVPSGTPVLDWTVPREWNLRGAWIEDAGGRRVVDAADLNLHVLGYSVPVDREVGLAELREHVHTLPDRPDLVPYRTSYYREDWGFCLSQRQLDALPEGRYRVRVDATLEDGSLTYGECVLPGDAPGEEPGEVLITCHVCHPSLANDNLSGIAVVTALGEALAATPHRHNYRLLFIPGTIGSIAWLARNEDRVGSIRHGIVVSGVGDPGDLTWKRSRRGDTTVDRAVAHVLRASGRPHELLDFTPYGYDERQFCSPGFDLPVGRLSRTPHGTYPEYHTSADDLDFVSPEALADSLEVLGEVVAVLEGEGRFRNLAPKGEPQLGRRGLYRSVGGGLDAKSRELALLWVLNLSDGEHSLLDIADRADLPFATIRSAADDLVAAGLLAPADA